MTDDILAQIRAYISEHIVEKYHAQRLQKIQSLELMKVLKGKNPYLFRAKNLLKASDLVASILDAYLSSSEEASFGEFLEGLAIHVAFLSYGGQKSVGTGLDLEFTRDGIRYLVSVKSGPSWGNASQYKSLRKAFADGLRVLKQGVKTPIQPVLGICYSKVRKSDNGLYQKVNGQDFWELISGDPNLYTELIEPIGFEAKKHDDVYQAEKAQLYNRFTDAFFREFCDAETGKIDWDKLVRFNSQTIRPPKPTKQKGGKHGKHN